MRISRVRVLGAVLLALALFVGACGGDDDDEAADNGDNGITTTGCAAFEGSGDITVGAIQFAENQIVAEMYAQCLEAAGWTVDRQLTLGSREILQPAMQSGEIDVAPEYLGTLLVFLDPEATPSGDPEENAAQLSPLLEENGQTLLEFSAANDTNAFVVTQETAGEFSLATVSDLEPVAGDLTLGGPAECPDRPFCIPGLEETYGVVFGDFVALDPGGPLTVEALDGGDVDVALLFSTSSVIGDKGWVVLEDDQNLQTADNITPVVNTEALTDDMASALNAISAELTTDNITSLNGRVEIDQEDPETVAADFLEEVGLL